MRQRPVRSAPNTLWKALVLLSAMVTRFAVADTEHGDFSTVDDLTLVGNARVVSKRLRLVPALEGQHGAVCLQEKQEVVSSFESRFRFVGGADLSCPAAADADNSGNLNVSDAIWILGYLFLGTDPPVAPFGNCGADPVQDSLDCPAYAACPSR